MASARHLPDSLPPDPILEDLRLLVEECETLLHLGTERIILHGEGIRRQLGPAWDAARDAARNLEEHAGPAVQDAARRVRNHPVEASLLALAGGVAVGLWVNRR